MRHRTWRGWAGAAAFLGFLLVTAASPALARIAGPAPDLTVSVRTDPAGGVHRGDIVTYAVAVTNTGDASATDVFIADELPDGTSPVGGVPSVDRPGSCTAIGASSPGGGTSYAVRCELPVLSAGETATMVFAARIGEDARCGALRDGARASAVNEPPDAVVASNRASASITLACVCGVRLEVDVSPTGPGRVRTIYLVTNTGDRATQVRVTDEALGPVGRVSLRPGRDRAFAQVWIVARGRVAARSSATATATGDDSSCRDRAVDRAGLAANDADGTGSSGEGAAGGETAFTGPSDLPVAAAALLLVVGLASLLVSRRRG